MKDKKKIWNEFYDHFHKHKPSLSKVFEWLWKRTYRIKAVNQLRRK